MKILVPFKFTTFDALTAKLLIVGFGELRDNTGREFTLYRDQGGMRFVLTAWGMPQAAVIDYAEMLACVSGTTLGRDVVPDVVRIRATSSSLVSASAVEAGFPDDAASCSSENAPAGPSAERRRRTNNPSDSAARMAGESSSSDVTSDVARTFSR